MNDQVVSGSSGEVLSPAQPSLKTYHQLHHENRAWTQVCQTPGSRHECPAARMHSRRGSLLSTRYKFRSTSEQCGDRGVALAAGPPWDFPNHRKMLRWYMLD